MKTQNYKPGQTVLILGPLPEFTVKAVVVRQAGPGLYVVRNRATGREFKTFASEMK
jgi:hypothetical protein